MKIVIVGTGSIGCRHINSVLKIDPTAEFVFLRAERRHDALSERLSASVVSSPKEAMEFHPDCVVISTPSSMHTDFILKFIEFGLPMYIEKPVVIQQKDVDLIRLHIDKYNYNASTMVGCNLRFLKSLQIMKKMIVEGQLGDIARASLQAGQWLPDWRPQQNYKLSYSADPERGGGVLWDLIHELDALRYLMGDFDLVKTMTTLFQPLDILSDAVAVLLMGKSEGGPLVTIGLDYVARNPIRRYELYGDKATLIWDLPNKLLLKYSQDGEQVITDNADDFDVAETYMSAMQEFLKSVKSNVPTTQGIQEGLKTAELAILAKEKV